MSISRPQLVSPPTGGHCVNGGVGVLARAAPAPTKAINIARQTVRPRWRVAMRRNRSMRLVPGGSFLLIAQHDGGFVDRVRSGQPPPPPAALPGRQSAAADHAPARPAKRIARDRLSIV